MVRQFLQTYQNTPWLPPGLDLATANKNGGNIVSPAHLDQDLDQDTEKDWAPPRVVVLGDSHGIMWSPAICEITEKLGLKTAFWSVEGVETAVTFPVRSTQAMQGMTPAEKAAYDVSRLDLINQWPPDLVILVLSVRRYPHGPA